METSVAFWPMLEISLDIWGGGILDGVPPPKDTVSGEPGK
jgi:hypothetical protein